VTGFNTRVKPVCALALAALLASACGTSSNAPKTGTTIVLDGHRVLNHGTVDVGGETIEDVDVHDYYFDPTVFTGSGGQSITLTLHNGTSTLHNFSLPLQRIDQDVPPGGSVQVSVTLPADGELVFFCKYHRRLGMLGEVRAG
jgi:plastocyanin